MNDYLYTDKKDNSTIDLLKFIGSIMIFCMHSFTFEDLGRFSYFWEYITRWCVPFFFLTSSYFLFSKGTEKNNNISFTQLKKYIKRILMLYLFWFIYNIPSVFVSRIYYNGINNPSTWINFFISLSLSSTFTGSWYLASSIFCAIVLFLLNKKIKTKYIVIITFPFYLICIFMSTYHGLLPNVISNILSKALFPLNIFCGLFYFSIGKLISENKKFFFTIKNMVLVLTGILFLALYLLEIYITKNSNLYNSSDCSFMIVPFSTIIFILSIKSTKQIKCSKLLRKYSTIIYCCQGNVLLLLAAIKKITGFECSILYGLVGLYITIFISQIVLFVQKKYKGKIFDYIS